MTTSRPRVFCSRVLWFTVAALALGCSSGSGADGGGGGGAGGGSGGAGGGQPCPSNAPASGASCASEGLECTWMECADAGITTARCTSGAYAVNREPCVAIGCGFQGNQCTPGQLCVTHQGGALITECQSNPCGSGPITCDCVCGGLCISGRGLNWTCNSCPSGQCP